MFLGSSKGFNGLGFLKNLDNVQCLALYVFNPIQDGGGAKIPLSPISFSPITSTSVGISSQNVLIFSFNLFATLVQNFKDIARASPKLMNLETRPPLKKCGFFGQILITFTLL